MKSMMTNPDAEDLRSYASHGDEAAFRRIVERHAPMVHGVAWRRMRDRALAEDVTQSVFIILARKAQSIPHPELGAWLYRTAFMETLNASRKEAKRQQALTQYTSMTSDTGPDWDEISPHLDEAICQLPAADRKLVVMRYFEQRDYAEIRHLTGCSEQTSRKQMQRALDRLGYLLRRRGVKTSTGTALGALLAAQSLCTPPASAAIIAGVALQSLPAVAAGSFSLFSTFSIMTTQTALKATAAILIVAAIPTAILLNRQDDATRAAASSPHSSAAAGDTGQIAATPVPQASSGREMARRAQNRTNSPKSAGPTLPDGMMKVQDVDWSEAMRKQSGRLSSRLTARLHLTPEQQAKLKNYLNERDRTMSEKLSQQMSDNRLTLASSDGNLAFNPSLLQLAVPEPDRDFDAYLDGLLTPEQKATNSEFREQERQENVRREAQAQIDDLSRYVDLTTEQKQQIFDQSEARSKEGSEQATPFEEQARQILTPDQLALYDAGKAEDNVPDGVIPGAIMISRTIKEIEPGK